MASGDQQHELFNTTKLSGWPSWFTPGKHTPAFHLSRVRMGRHPMGFELLHQVGTPTKTCGNCAHLVRNNRGTKVFLKCGKSFYQTSGPGSDTRAGYAACMLHERIPD
jgi:hypothetical protein